MEYKIDRNVVIAVLERLSSLRHLGDKIKSICDKYNILCTMRTEFRDFQGNANSSRSDNRIASSYPSVYMNQVIREDDVVFPFDSVLAVSPMSPAIYSLFCPVIYSVYSTELVLQNKKEITVNIYIGSRMLSDETSKRCTTWYLGVSITTQIAPKDRFENDRQERNFVYQLGVFSDNETKKDMSRFYSFLLSHLIGKNIRAASLTKELSNNEINQSLCFWLLAFKLFLKKHNLRLTDYVKEVSKDSLYILVNNYFAPIYQNQLDFIFDSFTLGNYGLDHWELDREDMFDYVQFIFYLLAIIFREIEYIINEIKSICGKDYEKVLQIILNAEDPIKSNNVTMNDLIIKPPLYYSIDLIEETLIRWKPKFKSLGEVEVRCERSNFPRISILDKSVSKLQAVLNILTDMSLELMEAGLSKRYSFFLYKNSSTVKERVMDWHINHYKGSENILSSKTKLITFDKKRYAASFSVFLSTVKLLLRSLIK